MTPKKHITSHHVTELWPRSSALKAVSMRKLEFSNFLTCHHFHLVIVRGMAAVRGCSWTCIWDLKLHVFLRLEEGGLSILEGPVCRLVFAAHGTDSRVWT